jgi:uncharacterized protein YcfL
MRILILPLLALACAGCVAQTAVNAAVDVVTLPVKAASAGIDAVTTSRAEADRKRGRQIRRQEQCLGKEARVAKKANREPDYARCETRKG